VRHVRILQYGRVGHGVTYSSNRYGIERPYDWRAAEEADRMLAQMRKDPVDIRS